MTFIKSFNPTRTTVESPFVSRMGKLFEHELRSHAETQFLPAANISEHAEKFVIEVAIPGIQKQNVKIQLENRLLRVVGERKSSQPEDAKHTMKEIVYGKFERAFTLPHTVDSEQIKAEFVDGMLVVSLPKKVEAQGKASREITID